MDELKKKLEELASAFEAFKKANDERLAQMSSKGHADPLVTEKMEKANADISRLNGEIDGLKTALNRLPGAGSNGGDQAKAESEKKAREYKEAFTNYMRKGVVESKTLSVDSDPDGGYLVTPEMSASIVKFVFESTPMRQIASQQTIGTDQLDIPVDIDQPAIGWVGESAARAGTTSPQWKKTSIPVHEIYAMPAATQKMLDDANIDIEAWLAAKVAEKFSREEATQFVTGNGVNKPRGFTTYASGTSWGQIEQVGTASSGNFTADALISLSYKLKEAFLKNAVWLMQRASEGLVRQLKDSQNRYLWAPALDASRPNTLLGYPIYQAADMATAGANSLSAAFGDFKSGYQIVDRIGIRVLRDPYTTKGQILFYTTKRVGGDVVNFDAIKLLKLG